MENQKKPIDMRILITTLITLLLAVFVHTAQAQKKPYYTEQEQIIEAAYIALDNEMKSGELLEWAAEKNIKGTYTFDMTIRHKGEVSTIMAVAREGEISHQNALKNYLKEIKFPFKMPKNKSYKFKYEFKF